MIWYPASSLPELTPCDNGLRHNVLQARRHAPSKLLQLQLLFRRVPIKHSWWGSGRCSWIPRFWRLSARCWTTWQRCACGLEHSCRLLSWHYLAFSSGAAAVHTAPSTGSPPHAFLPALTCRLNGVTSPHPTKSLLALLPGNAGSARRRGPCHPGACGCIGVPAFTGRLT